MAWSRMCTCTVSDRQACVSSCQKAATSSCPSHGAARTSEEAHLSLVCVCVPVGCPVCWLPACRPVKQAGETGEVPVADGSQMYQWLSPFGAKKLYGVCFRNVIGSWYASSIYAFTTFFCWMLSPSWTIESLIITWIFAAPSHQWLTLTWWQECLSFSAMLATRSTGWRCRGSTTLVQIEISLLFFSCQISYSRAN